MEFKKQVDRKYYIFKNYDSKERFIGYWHQISEVIKTNPKTILEIGIGNKTVTNSLKSEGFEVTTIDIAEDLKPDYIGSVTELTSYFKENSFDTILCSEVLEHIPFQDFEKSLSEMQKVTKKYVVLSLPYFSFYLSLSFKLFLMKKKNICLNIPFFFLTHRFDGNHYWEIGKRNYPLRKIRTIINKYFKIEREYLIPESPYHRFFILKVRKNDER